MAAMTTSTTNQTNLSPLTPDATRETQQRAQTEVARVRTELAHGRASQADLESAEWRLKEATIRHEEALRLDRERADEERRQRVAKFRELESFVKRGYTPELAAQADKVAEAIVTLELLISSTIDETLAKVRQAATDASTLSTHLTADDLGAPDNGGGAAERKSLLCDRLHERADGVDNHAVRMVRDAVKRRLERLGRKGMGLVYLRAERFLDGGRR